MKRSDRLGLRVNPQDKQLWKTAAASEGKSLSNWIEQTLNAAARHKDENG